MHYIACNVPKNQQNKKKKTSFILLYQNTNNNCNTFNKPSKPGTMNQDQYNKGSELDITFLCQQHNIPCPQKVQLHTGKTVWVYSPQTFKYQIDDIVLSNNVLKKIIEFKGQKYDKFISIDPFIDYIIDHPHFTSWFCPASQQTPYINSDGDLLTIPLYCCQPECQTKLTIFFCFC